MRKSKRMGWVGHVVRMGYGRGVYKVFMEGTEGKRTLGKPTRKWEDTIKIYLQEVE